MSKVDFPTSQEQRAEQKSYCPRLVYLSAFDGFWVVNLNGHSECVRVEELVYSTWLVVDGEINGKIHHKWGKPWLIMVNNGESMDNIWIIDDISG